jgi:RES domain-containing protein
LTALAWRIATDTPNYEADDLSGAGAEMTGGRWNNKGSALVYAASSPSLATLETVVHFNAMSLPLNRYLVLIEIPDEIWKARTVAGAMGVGWDAIPEGRVSRAYGESWLKSRASALLCVPSVIMPEDLNILINPAHPDAAKIKAMKKRKLIYDGRLLAPARPH